MMWVANKEYWNPLISDLSRFHGIRLRDIEDDLIDSRTFFAYASQIIRYEDGALFHFVAEQQEQKNPAQNRSGTTTSSSQTNEVPPEYLMMQTDMAYQVNGG